MHDAALDRGCRGLRAVLHAEFVQDVLHVVLDGVLGDVQVVRDLLIGVALARSASDTWISRALRSGPRRLAPKAPRRPRRADSARPHGRRGWP